MALNSAVTVDGGETSRAQAVQAEACYLEPTVAVLCPGPVASLYPEPMPVSEKRPEEEPLEKTVSRNQWDEQPGVSEELEAGIVPVQAPAG